MWEVKCGGICGLFIPMDRPNGNTVSALILQFRLLLIYYLVIILSLR